jgi:WD40 repeat protein
MRRIIREEDPPRPSTRISTAGELPGIAASCGLGTAKLIGLVKGELDWIVMKCLEKDRNRRYETASGLAADVGRFLADEPVLACSPSAWYRFRKFARRNQRAVVTAAALAVGLVLAVGALAASTFLIARALRSETEAKGQLAEALERERVDAYFHRVTLAHHALSADDLARALKLLGECPEDLRAWEWHYLNRLCRVEPLVLRDKTEVNSLAFSPDGQAIAAACGDGTVKVWDSKTGKVVQRLDAHPGAVFSVAFHPEGKHLASAGADQQVKVWDLTTRREVFAGPCGAVHNVGTAYCVAFSPGDGRQLAAGCDGALKVWGWRNGQTLHTFAGHDKQAISVAFSRDGRRLASGDWRGSVTLWDPEAGGEPPRSFLESRESRHVVAALAFSPDGARLATGNFGRRVNVWDTAAGRLSHTLQHGGLVMGVAFSPDGRLLASAGEDKVVRVRDAATGREVLALRGHTDWCGCVAFSPGGRRLASASRDGTIRVWDATPLEGHEGEGALTFKQHGDEVWSVAVSPDGQRVVSAGFDTSAKVWGPRTGQVTSEFSGHSRVVFCAAWQHGGRRIATAGRAGELFTVKVWDVRTGREVFALPPRSAEYFAVAFSPDGRHLVTGSAKGAIQVWNAGTGDLVGPLGSHDRQVRGVVFSRDGRQLASASGDGVVKLWDATRLNEAQEPYRTFRARVPGQCLNVAFSPEGRRLVTGGQENTVKVWDVRTGDELQTLLGHSGDVYAVAFSPDPGGRWVASAGEDTSVKVWDSRTGKLLRNFRGHTGLVSSVAFLPDGTRLISGSRDHTVKVWDVTQLEEGADR